ncbi:MULTISPECIES: ArsR/SmtB family transcription factor [Chelativorans]|uniref:Transcriptional regulator, ArsR family n=1 Tax=Chelativorans sp. (strain BNC1) TaxID=266779 RepID=Q11ED9_CHESB|nr:MULTISPECIES: metalloregulator ArsR/SmtB family transcription factor [Chelativorans]
MPMTETQQLDRLFVALADAGRRGMVEQLSKGPATVTQLAKPAGMRLPSAVKHLKLLEEGGIIVSHKEGRTRTYRMRPDALRPVRDWVRQREAALNAAFDQLMEAMNDNPEEELES